MATYSSRAECASAQGSGGETPTKLQLRLDPPASSWATLVATYGASLCWRYDSTVTHFVDMVGSKVWDSETGIADDPNCVTGGSGGSWGIGVSRINNLSEYTWNDAGFTEVLVFWPHDAGPWGEDRFFVSVEGAGAAPGGAQPSAIYHNWGQDRVYCNSTTTDASAMMFANPSIATNRLWAGLKGEPLILFLERVTNGANIEFRFWGPNGSGVIAAMPNAINFNGTHGNGGDYSFKPKPTTSHYTDVDLYLGVSSLETAPDHKFGIAGYALIPGTIDATARTAIAALFGW